MSHHIPVRHFLTEAEFNRLWDIAGTHRRVGLQEHVASLCPVTETPSEVKRYIDEENDIEAARFIVNEAFSKAEDKNRSTYDKAHFLSSGKVFKELASTFNNLAERPSGLIIPLAKLITGILGAGYKHIARKSCTSFPGRHLGTKKDP